MHQTMQSGSGQTEAHALSTTVAGTAGVIT
jgi:hypothetical protein